ncbi:MAG: MoaD/ThiS family protein [Elusimicrobia bacterium]|nr:MoaD/ThiS family protein [Elusimicrobiota bacterium]
MAIEYRVRAHANLRHYLPGAKGEARIDAPRPLKARELLEELKIPEGEVMMVAVRGEAVKLESVIEEGCEVELFPVLSGG